MNKPKIPIICRIRLAVTGGSPSAIWSRCVLGVRRGTRYCEECEFNVKLMWTENFYRGMTRNQRKEVDTEK